MRPYISPSLRKRSKLAFVMSESFRHLPARGLASLLACLCLLMMMHGGCGPDAEPRATADNGALVELGRHLFYERRLSMNENRSCGICHEQAKGFTDGFVRAVGTRGDIHPRNTHTLLNVQSRETLSWLDPTPMSLAEQMLIPLLGTTPVEMGAHNLIDGMLESLSDDATYQALLRNLTPPRTHLDVKLATEAISAFTVTIVDYDSPYDRYLAGNVDALSAQEQEGKILFFSDRTGCSDCHGGLDFDAPATGRHGWVNTGLYNLGNGRYPNGREGLYEITGLEKDIGKYRIPTLRHLRHTWPYYHDGTGASLSDVLENYNNGGRNVRSGPYVGDGRTNPHKDSRIQPLSLTPSELDALEAFLLCLSSDGAISNPEWSDPWPRDD